MNLLCDLGHVTRPLFSQQQNEHRITTFYNCTLKLGVQASHVVSEKSDPERQNESSKGTQDLHSRGGFDISLILGLVFYLETCVRIWDLKIAKPLGTHDLPGCVLVICQLYLTIPVLQMRRLRGSGNVPIRVSTGNIRSILCWFI